MKERRDNVRRREGIGLEALPEAASPMAGAGNGRLCHEYQGILSNDSKPAYERFWKLDGRIRKNRRMACVECTLSRSTMDNVLHEPLAEGAITLEDLDGMSEELQSA